MIIAIGFALTSLVCFVGARKAFSSAYDESIRHSVRIYGGLFLNLGFYFALIAVVNAFLVTPRAVQVVIYLALFLFLFVGVGYGVYFNFLLLGRKYTGRVLVVSVFILGITLFLAQLFTEPLPVLLRPGTSLSYWDPQFNTVTVFATLGWIFTAVLLYSTSFLKTALSSQSPIIREKSFFMASGAFVAGIGGFVYFISHLLLSKELLPQVVSIVPIVAIIGFSLMALPLFITKPLNE